MIRAALHDKVSDILVDRRLLGDLRTTGVCYTENGVAEPGDDPNPSFCVLHSALDTFDMSNQKLSEGVAKAIVTVLETNPQVRYFNFSGSNVGERLSDMAPIFKCDKMRLYSLNLSFCKLGSGSGGVGFERVVSALRGMVSPVKELSVVGNDLTSGDVVGLAEWVSGNVGLKLLDVGLNAGVGVVGLQALAAALGLAGHPLQSLGLSGIGLTDADAPVVSALLQHPAFKVEFLDLSWNVMGVTSPGHMASILGQSPSIRELHMMAMKLGPNGSLRLFDSFAGGNTTLQVLHLGSDYIPASATAEFSSFLANVPNLLWLDMVSNFLTGDFFHATAPAFLASRLSILSLANCNLQDDLSGLALILASSTTLHEVHLNFNNTTDLGALIIASALASPSSSLLHLRLDENEISLDGANAILNALQSNQRLLSLDLADNDFDPASFPSFSFPHMPLRAINLYPR